jgi:hypothetical protein
MCLQYAMDDGDVCAGDLVHCDVASVISFMDGIREKEQVTAVECWFHRATIDDT